MLMNDFNNDVADVSVFMNAVMNLYSATKTMVTSDSCRERVSASHIADHEFGITNSMANQFADDGLVPVEDMYTIVNALDDMVNKKAMPVVKADYETAIGTLNMVLGLHFDNTNEKVLTKEVD